MRFLTDQNVQQVVPNILQEHGYDVVLSRDILGPEAEDPIIAAAAMEDDRILVSHDHDMRRIERYVSEKHRERFPNLNRLMLACEEAAAADRLSLYLPMIQTWHQICVADGCQLLVEIGRSRLRVFR